MYAHKCVQVLSLLSTLLPTAIALPKRQSDPTQVKTSNGIVQGHIASWPDNTDVIEFLGIPYAQPPLGQLRFAPPQAYNALDSEVYMADNFSQDCLQYTGSASSFRDASRQLASYGYGMGGGSAADPHSYGEDCLTINVWAKPSGQQNKAVMLWIYGGAFATGTSNAPFYSGARLADEEDVVVVSFNYRISIFGFPIAPGLSDQNLGLLDQRLAVEWVRDNIAGFGGDPSRITLFGESAGGSSVDYYAYAWTEDPIVNGFIAQSGTALILFGTDLDFSDWYEISDMVGCGGEEAGSATVDCVRKVNATDVINAVGDQASLTGGITTHYGPIADGKVVFADVADRSAAGNFIQRPFFVGNNDEELGLLLGIASGALPSWISGFFESVFSGPITEGTIDVGSASAFNCPAATAAKDRASNNVPTWRYRYMGVWENTALAPGMGAYHSSEIPFALGTNPRRVNVTADVPEEAELQEVMMHAWAEFAKDPDNGLTALGWPKYDPDGDTLIRLGYNNLSTASFASSTEYDTLCPIVGP